MSMKKLLIQFVLIIDYMREREKNRERERERDTSMGDFSTVNPVVFGLCLFVFLDSSSFSSFNSCTIIN